MLLRLCAAFLLLGLLSCSRSTEDTPIIQIQQPPAAATPRSRAPAPTARPASRYRTYRLDGASALAALVRQLGAERMMLIYKLNRRDLEHLKAGDSIVVPTDLDSDLAYSPFPPRLASADTLAKLIVVSRRVQAFGAYEHGKLMRWGPTSTGKRSTPTPEGLYHTNWKSKETHSTVDESWVMKWYFNLDNLEGISMHEYDLPGYPASHSCVRLLSADAYWIYNWADQWKLAPDGATVAEHGTPVIVFGTYAYGKTPPWKRLATNDTACVVASAELDTALNRFLMHPTAVNSAQ